MGLSYIQGSSVLGMAVLIVETSLVGNPSPKPALIVNCRGVLFEVNYPLGQSEWTRVDFNLKPQPPEVRKVESRSRREKRVVG